MKQGTKNDIICWWSGGITSAVACMLAIDMYGVENCRFIFIDTKNEDEDTYRFMKDCEQLYGKKMETITAVGESEKYSDIQDVWHTRLSLNVAHGAICSSELKRAVRLKFQRRNKYKHQVFGFDISETNRANNLSRNYPAAKPIYPLIEFNQSKKDCFAIIKEQGIKIPNAYNLGFHNNNCLQTGCVQGGVGYWQKMQKDFPNKFLAMAKLEHELTDLKGKPITCMKNQTKRAKASKTDRLFLLAHPDYPQFQSLEDKRPKSIEPLIECNGFCGMQGKLFE